MLVNATNITIQYLNKPLIKNASFVINEGTKIGLIGANGVGKSSLLKVLTNNETLNDGLIAYKKDIRIGYLSQNDRLNDNDTILDNVLSIAKCEEYNAKSICSKMGLDDTSLLVKNLSGGMKKRLSLAITLVEKVDLLILDEPTNHLDVWMISFLESYLSKLNTTLLLVTHDRYFLERVCTSIMEIDNQSIYYYDVPYSKYLPYKAQRLIDYSARQRKMIARLKVESAWASMNPQARSTKSKERLERFSKLEDEVNTMKSIKDTQVTISSFASRLGKSTIEINNITKSIDNKVLFKDFSYNILRYDRIGIVGENGCGKTTLFNTILGLLMPDSGYVKIGETVKVGYLKQKFIIDNININVIDFLKDFGEFVDTINGRISITSLAEEYQFTPNMLYSPISKLSGGELKRLQILSVFLSNPNILFLDEPTNDLDIFTLEVLEEAIENFRGAVICVSHDRYFLDKVADKLFVFEDGSIKIINGIVSDYISENSKLVKKDIIKEKKEVNIPRFTSQEKKEFDHIEEDIELIENKISSLKKELSLITSDYMAILNIQKEIDEQESLLEEKLNRWEYLSSINEKIIEYKNNKYNGGTI